jgi:hypothetical protein
MGEGEWRELRTCGTFVEQLTRIRWAKHVARMGGAKKDLVGETGFLRRDEEQREV